MAAAAMTIDAPKELQAWLARNEDKLLASGVACDLRVPRDSTDTSKASLALDAGVVLGSVTIWATGMIEFIVISKRTRSELAVRDLEMLSAVDLREALSNLLEEFTEFVSMERNW